MTTYVLNSDSWMMHKFMIVITDDEDYEIYYNRSKSDKIYFQDMDAMIVGEIVDCESSN